MVANLIDPSQIAAVDRQFFARGLAEERRMVSHP
jgi:hypothetical protein